MNQHHARCPAYAKGLVLSLIVLLIAGCGTNGSRGSPGKPALSHQEIPIVVPAYVDPSDSSYWQAVVTSAPAVRDVILNPANGPGKNAHAIYRPLIARLRMTGIKVLGYVRTDKGGRSASAVDADVVRWKRFYGVRDVFFDEASTSAADLGRYRAYVATVHRAGGIAVLNPGTVPARGYFSFADAIVTFEDTASRYLQASMDSSRRASEPHDKVWQIVLDVSRSRLSSVLARAAKNRIAQVYVTDDAGPNPYDTLPSYWPRE